MKTLVVYRSFLGSSKKYAQWLHEEIPSDMMKYSKASDKVLTQYDAVAIFGGTYAGKLSLGGWIQKKWPVLKGKKVVFVTVAGAPDTEPTSIRAYQAIPEEIRSAVKHFHLRGKFGKTNAAEVTKEKVAPIAAYVKSLG
jgi:flavodoxin